MENTRHDLPTAAEFPNMSPVFCAHTDARSGGLACEHLVAQPIERIFSRWFTGSGLTYHLLCPLCAKHVTTHATAVPLQGICSACFSKIQEDGDWEGIVGQPEIIVRATQLDLHTATLHLHLPGRVVALAPLPQNRESIWLAITDIGEVLLLDLDAPHWQSLFHMPTSLLDLTKPLALVVAPDGRFATVTQGHHGLVIDVQSGQMTMPLMRDDHALGQFSVAFAKGDGRLILIHATAWNRVDISDPQTGALLSGRTPIYDSDPARRFHYRDYFHCSIVVSPDAEWIVDMGWVWSPVGMPVVWSLRRWLTENAWESEDGPSLKTLTHRWYAWDDPVCWLDNEDVAIWGYGEDEEWMIPAANIFNARTGEQVRWFPGPRGAFFFDEYLFALSPQDGLTGWDATTGERVLSVPQFRPTHYHPGARRFLQWDGTTGEMTLGWVRQ